MIFKILLYFFLIFGIANFFMMLWQLLFPQNGKEKEIFVILPIEENNKSNNDTDYIFEKSPCKIYSVSQISNCNFENIRPITLNQLREEIHKIYGDHNRKC